ncbi:hypothetical protein KRP22_004422 [Phytophthora ramorum]|nr:hypothetical protein KRP22_13525 [Phytophthora ramorum]
MPADEVDIDDLRAEAAQSPDKFATHTSSSNSRSTSSNSFQAYSMGDEDEQPSDYRRVQQASSFDVEQMIHMRESNFRDSLMPGGHYAEPGGSNQDSSGSNSGGRPTEMGNALMRMDDGYRRAYNSIQRPSTTTPDATQESSQASCGSKRCIFWRVVTMKTSPEAEKSSGRLGSLPNVGLRFELGGAE